MKIPVALQILEVFGIENLFFFNFHIQVDLKSSTYTFKPLINKIFQSTEEQKYSQVT